MTDRIVILGAAGDLAGRYLLPALAELHRDRQLPDRLRILGSGRHEWSDREFREHVTGQLSRHAVGVPDGFDQRLAWQHADATDPADLRSLLVDADSPVLYLALPPTVYGDTVDALRQVRVDPDLRLVVEKPFGTGLDSARDLNRRIARVLPERAVFRVDHFLAQQTVQNLLGLRFANRLFEPVWNHAHLECVDIVWDETLGLEGRAGYYDHTGALRDMLQNHLLQLLALVAMEPPAGLGERDLRDRKVDVLRATRPVTAADSPRPSVRARYTAGTAAGRGLPDYTAEEGVDPQRRTETYAESVLLIDNWRWAGVPFRLRSGKAMGERRTEIVLWFRPVPHTAFRQPEQARPNVLRVGLNPDRISLGLNLNSAGDPSRLEPAELDLRVPPQRSSPYARLLLDIMANDPILSIRDDEAEEAWRIVTPVLEDWRQGAVPLETYPAGSAGPPRAEPPPRDRAGG